MKKRILTLLLAAMMAVSLFPAAALAEMCIRDRPGGGREQVRNRPHLPPDQPEGPGPREQHHPAAVSYTHLDVYKRQGIDCAARNSPIPDDQVKENSETLRMTRLISHSGGPERCV